VVSVIVFGKLPEQQRQIWQEQQESHMASANALRKVAESATVAPA